MIKRSAIPGLGPPLSTASSPTSVYYFSLARTSQCATQQVECVTRLFFMIWSINKTMIPFLQYIGSPYISIVGHWFIYLVLFMFLSNGILINLFHSLLKLTKVCCSISFFLNFILIKIIFLEETHLTNVSVSFLWFKLIHCYE